MGPELFTRPGSSQSLTLTRSLGDVRQAWRLLGAMGIKGGACSDRYS